MADLLEETSQQAIVLKSYRKEKKLSQIKLAEILDVDQSLISKIECGEKEISKSLAKKLGKTFDIDYRVFL
ncbi:MAG: helix-turn-helix transcriptional regulator [Deltaproteobacteria bacterium]|nr:helix-turn-helix transcriptional regulator [Deltaproteobacteria bacterium]